jgi:hypothetical protein
MPRGVKAGVNRSEAIREYLKMDPQASPSDIKQALAAKGVNVSDSLISAVKYRKPKGKKKKKGRKPGRPAAAKATRRAKPAKTAAKSAGGTISIDSLMTASKLVESMGGVENATKALGVLKRLQS